MQLVTVLFSPLKCHPAVTSGLVLPQVRMPRLEVVFARTALGI